MKLTIKDIRLYAAKKNKKIVYNRTTGYHQVRSEHPSRYAYLHSEGVNVARDEKGRFVFSQEDLKTLMSEI